MNRTQKARQLGDFMSLLYLLKETRLKIKIKKLHTCFIFSFLVQLIETIYLLSAHFLLAILPFHTICIVRTACIPQHRSLLNFIN